MQACPSFSAGSPGTFPRLIDFATWMRAGFFPRTSVALGRQTDFSIRKQSTDRRRQLWTVVEISRTVTISTETIFLRGVSTVVNL